jgi:hypothetical protein
VLNADVTYFNVAVVRINVDGLASQFAMDDIVLMKEE